MFPNRYPLRHYIPALESVVVNDGCMDNFDSDIATNLFLFFREDIVQLIRSPFQWDKPEMCQLHIMSMIISLVLIVILKRPQYDSLWHLVCSASLPITNKFRLRHIANNRPLFAALVIQLPLSLTQFHRFHHCLPHDHCC